jgi:hypothetical protein
MKNTTYFLLNTGDNNPIVVYGFMMTMIVFMIAILHSSRKGVRFSKHMKI